jgi:hypothetical protein
MRNLLFIPLLAVALLAGPAAANDTSVTLAAGGLKFTHSKAIELKSEDLFISQDEVRVRYVFHNKTASDVTLAVAFPLPELKAEWQESPLNIPDGGEANFIAFRTTADGKPLPLSLERKARKGARDVTAVLLAAGAPLNPLDPKFSDRIAALGPDRRAALLKAKLIDQDEADFGEGMKPYYRPTWDMTTTYYRQQTFPAGKDVVVEHAYKPIVGGTVQPLAASPEVWKQERKRYVRDYCVEPAFEAMAKTLDVTKWQERWIGYILKTGANWAGPIGEFRLVVDKGNAKNLVSFCGTNVTRISPTQFEMRATNFTPTRDLNILVLTHAE